MNPVYSPGSSGVPYANAKGIGYPANIIVVFQEPLRHKTSTGADDAPGGFIGRIYGEMRTLDFEGIVVEAYPIRSRAGFPMGYAAAAPAYSPNMYPGANPTFQTGYTPGTPYKVSCSPTSGAVPPYSSSPNPYQTAVYPVRSAYPQQSPYAQQGTYYTQPLYAAPPHVIHHTTVVQPNGMPATVYPAPIPPPRGNGVTMGMVAGTTMAMSAGYPADRPLPNSCCPPPSHCAHVSGPRNAHLQLRAPSVVITLQMCLRMELCSHILEVPQLVLQALRLQPGLSS
ncbi:myelin-associated neurite-outgrowth inhibitor isoform X1 [Prionailurus iriomotensis]